MSDEQKRPRTGEGDDPRSTTTLVTGAVGISLLVALLFALQAVYYHTVETEHLRKVVEELPEELLRVQGEQLERIGSYRWVDREKGVVAIPIDRAMDLLVEEGARPDGVTPEAVVP